MIYFDNAATGFPKSKAVLAAMESAFHTCGNAGRSGHPAAVAASEAIYNCREALAKFLSADYEK
ncbi:MAG: aminotransferase class V-fold PLP-dependent enzyme, partial [Clostridia bacterium]